MGKSSKSHKEEPHYEFLGPFGVGLAMLVLPLVVAFLFLACNASGCVSSAQLAQVARLDFSTPWLHFPASDTPLVWFSWPAVAAIVGWFAFQVFLHRVLPGPLVHGVKLTNGTRLLYRCNGMLCFIATLLVLVVTVSLGWLPATWIADNFLPLATAASLFSLVLSGYLFVKSQRERADVHNRSPGGQTGNVVYDFWIGRQLNPRLGFLDWKFFCELRPGLIGWLLINMSLAAKQYTLHGYVSNSMLLVNVFQFWYVADALMMERAILTTMDIVEDGFGFMLAFGDLAWVPFTYCTQARVLADYPVDLSWQQLAGILLVQGIGYWVFRSSNAQKNAFRTDPNAPGVAHLRTIKTHTGTELIISGWWGMARHINYFGDWIMAVAWCLPTGFASPIPYFYAVYFAVLLMHRERRDEHKCHKKYGADWEKYCSIVPYRIVPFVY